MLDSGGPPEASASPRLRSVDQRFTRDRMKAAESIDSAQNLGCAKPYIAELQP